MKCIYIIFLISIYLNSTFSNGNIYKIIPLLMLFLLIVNYFFIISGDIINTPKDYYDLIQLNKFENFSKIQIKANSDNLGQHNLFYPDICNNATKNLVGKTIFTLDAFPGSPRYAANIKITKGMIFTIIIFLP